MIFRTKIDIPQSKYKIQPNDRLLFVGSCFASNIGQRFCDNAFQCVVNPRGTMYNPASVYHCIRDYQDLHPNIVVITLGTNHVYRLKSTGEIVDNCQKQPANIFNEEVLSIDECADYLQKAIDVLKGQKTPFYSSHAGRESGTSLRVEMEGAIPHFIITVSPIRYAKYGFHESQLSKSVLLLAAEKVVRENENCDYFPAYEIVNDELRDYRFYNADMLHPSEQAVDYIWERFSEAYFSEVTHRFIEEWQPIRAALNHKPFNPDSEEYKTFLAQALEKKRKFFEKYGLGSSKFKVQSHNRKTVKPQINCTW
ncbi:MAG: GSCFA domain-containing protein [Prevotellaceae bacterium]|nr:GSCFA domain-containing protein [Prevotellaceae bacterium]